MTLVDVGPLLALAWQRHEAHERMVAWLSGVTVPSESAASLRWGSCDA